MHVNCLFLVLHHEIRVVATLMIKLIGCFIRRLDAVHARHGLFVINHLLAELLLHLGSLPSYRIKILHVMRLLKILRVLMLMIHHGHILLSLILLIRLPAIDATAK